MSARKVGITLIAVAGVAGAVLAAAAWSLTPKLYSSTAVFRVLPPPSIPSPTGTGAKWKDLTEDRFLESLITDPALDLYPEERQRLPMLDVVEQMAHDRHSELTHDGGGMLWVDTFTYADAHKALAVAHALTEQLEEIGLPLTRTMPYQNRLLLEETPKLPGRPDGPSRVTYLTVGLAAGLLVGLLVIAICRQPKRSLAVAAGGLTGAWLAIGLSFLMPAHYVSKTLILVQPRGPGQRLDVWLDTLEHRVYSPESIASIIDNPTLNLYRWRTTGRTLSALALNMVQRDVRTERIHGAGDSLIAIRISFSYADSYKAQRALRDLSSRIVETNFNMGQHGSDTTVAAPPHIDIAESANRPDTPEGPQRLTIALIGLGVGALAAILCRRRGNSPS
jgi:hypothetical protein